MNFLQLCQKVARESGTVAGDTQPSTVAGQTGKLLRIVEWVRDAYTDIQNEHPDWLWLQAEFSATLLSGLHNYTGVQIAGSRFADWLFDPVNVVSGFYVYLAADGLGSKTPVQYIPYAKFRQLYDPDEAANVPQGFTIAPDREIRFMPKPDAAYTFIGSYRKGPQTLTADTDTPEMPERHHSVIWRLALLYLDTYEENGSVQGQMNQVWSTAAGRRLRRDQLPTVGMAGPLA